MTRSGFEYRFREPLSNPKDRGVPKPKYSRTTEDNMLIERNVSVRMRDAVRLYVDVLRPVDEQQPVPAIICWTPYGKHQNGSAIYAANPGCEVKPGQVSKYATFEAVDPAYWVPHGYAVVNVDIRGMYYSQGTATFVSPEEALDFYDVIEWAGTRPWSNGRVGLSGVSYLAVSQWRVAELKPPHLAAINPWEGWTDTYREIALHGGIPDTWFWNQSIVPAWGCGTDKIEDLLRERAEHPFFDDYWKSKAVDFAKIDVPAFIVACWADQGLHERGTLEGFKRIASGQKWLEVHGRKKWAYYYDPVNVERLREFFDHFLKGTSATVLRWPKVRLEIRERYFVGKMQSEREWPIARTQYRRLYLDAESGRMSSEAPTQTSSCSYDSLGGGPGAHRAQFEIVFQEPTELKLKPGEIVPLEIEIWPSGTHFSAGERLRLIVQGTDLQKYSKKRDFVYYRHEDTVNSGSHVLYTGGLYDSYLLVPVVPPRERL